VCRVWGAPVSRVDSVVGRVLSRCCCVTYSLEVVLALLLHALG
jgi:hypothetical protein